MLGPDSGKGIEYSQRSIIARWQAVKVRWEDEATAMRKGIDGERKSSA